MAIALSHKDKPYLWIESSSNLQIRYDLSGTNQFTQQLNQTQSDRLVITFQHTINAGPIPNSLNLTTQQGYNPNVHFKVMIVFKNDTGQTMGSCTLTIAQNHLGTNTVNPFVWLDQKKAHWYAESPNGISFLNPPGAPPPHSKIVYTSSGVGPNETDLWTAPANDAPTFDPASIDVIKITINAGAATVGDSTSNTGDAEGQGGGGDLLDDLFA